MSVQFSVLCHLFALVRNTKKLPALYTECSNFAMLSRLPPALFSRLILTVMGPLVIHHDHDTKSTGKNKEKQ